MLGAAVMLSARPRGDDEFSGGPYVAHRNLRHPWGSHAGRPTAARQPGGVRRARIGAYRRTV